MGTIEDIIAVAPPDVAEAIRWLTTNGASSTKIEPRHGMGFALAEFVLADLELRVISDRDQWNIELRRPNEPWLQFDLIHAIITNLDWSATISPPSDRLTGPVRQHPVGVSWRNSLPGAIEWLRTTPTAVDEVNDAGRRRAKAIFR